MVNALPKLSIVCPAFEEEEVLPLFHRALSIVLERLPGPLDVEILYVDDGSRDRTLEVIQELARSDSRIRYLSFSRNFGHQAALTAGLEHARGDAVIMMDSDLQHPPGLIPVLLAKWQAGADVVLTIREEDERLGWFKRLTSRTFYRVMGWLSDTEIRFAAADYRLMSRRALDGLLQLRETHRFLRGMVQWLGFPTEEVSFRPDVRKAGVSKYTVGRMLRFASDAVISFSRVPLRVSLAAGSLAILASLLYAGVVGVRYLRFHDQAEVGWASLLASLYLLGGCMLCGLGIVGEYVGRIYEQVKGRPLYVLKATSADATSARVQPGRGRAA
jgi:polyisoprenyl-phosphate glycosyltransferase